MASRCVSTTIGNHRYPKRRRLLVGATLCGNDAGAADSPMALEEGVDGSMSDADAAAGNVEASDL
jgi:hypothetical protein